MATNTKRRTRGKPSVSSASPRNYSHLYKNDNTVSAPATQAASAVKASESRYASVKSAEVVDWKKQYSYVMSDLRLLLIVSIALIAIIVVAGFFI